MESNTTTARYEGEQTTTLGASITDLLADARARDEAREEEAEAVREEIAALREC